MSFTKSCLFGGALLTAGMTANAQQFIINANDSTGAYPSFAQSQANGDPAPYGDYVYAPAPLNTSSTAYTAAYGTNTFSTSETSNTLRAEAIWDGAGSAGFGYGFNNIQAFFQVSQDADLVLSWDVSGTDGFVSAIVIEDASGTTLLDVDPLAGDALSGSETVSLTAGTDYAFIGGMTNGGFGPFIEVANETQFIQAQLVPAPGAMGLLGVAGLAATRRRRS